MPIRTLVWTLLLAAFGVTYAQGYEWRDVVQTVEIRSDGSVIVEDTRTLVATQGDVSGASICLDLAPDQRLDLLGGGALREGPAARIDTQPCANGTALVITMAGGERITERRVFFWYALRDTLDYYRDVTQWQRALPESNHPPVRGYSLTVTAPGPMQAPYTAYIDRSGTPQDASRFLSNDRSQLQVTFDRISAGDNVEVRYLMDPGLFEQRGSRAGLEPLQRDATGTGTTGTMSEFRDALQTWIDDALTWLRGVVPAKLSVADKTFVALLAALFLITAIIAVAVRRVRRRVGGDFGKIPRRAVFEPPSDLPPAVVGAMIEPRFMLDFSREASQSFYNTYHIRRTFRQGFSATVMDLARRGYCELRRSRHTQQITRTSGITLHHDRNQNVSSPLEQKVLGYLRDAKQHSRNYSRPSERYDSDHLTFSELRSYSQQEWRAFTRNWAPEIYEYVRQYLGGMPFTDASIEAARYWGMITRRWMRFGFVLSFISFILLVEPHTMGIGMYFSYSSSSIGFAISLTLFVVSFVLARLNAFIKTDMLALRSEVVSEVRGWLGFRQTLSDYSIMRDAPDDFFVLWDRYFCYAAAFGVAQGFLQNIRRVIPERDLSESDMTAQVSWMDSDSLDDMSDLSSLSDIADSLSDTLDSISDSTGDSSSDGGDGGGDGD